MDGRMCYNGYSYNLVNGSPTDFFSIEKGLCQGDLLSPLLFNICVNGFSCMLNKIVTVDNPCDFSIGNGLVLNHLQSLDDTLILFSNNADHIQKIGAGLEMFLAISGPKRTIPSPNYSAAMWIKKK